MGSRDLSSEGAMKGLSSIDASVREAFCVLKGFCPNCFIAADKTQLLPRQC